MYFNNLILIIFAWPFLALMLLKIKRKRFIQLLSIFIFSFSFLFFILSTFLFISFKNNYIDLVFIHLFLISIYFLCFKAIEERVTFNQNTYAGLKAVTVILCIAIYLLGFGPGDSCGKNLPSNNYSMNENYQLTMTGYLYGFMDYGSRFILNKKYYLFEKIEGYYHQPNHYYSDIRKIQLIDGNKYLIVSYLDYGGNYSQDSLVINTEY